MRLFLPNTPLKEIFLYAVFKLGWSEMDVIASAPGKVILVGEHFVVENEPAVALALELRAKVLARERKGEDRYYSRNFNKALTVRQGKIVQGGENIDLFRPLIRIAEIIRERAGEDSNFELMVDSEIPPASGMGSSAAVAVATVAALGKFYSLDLAREEISQIAYEAEKVVHGKPSGIDNTISTYGGAIVFRKSEGFIRLNVKLNDVVIILADSGIPRRTGDMVLKVKKLKEKYSEILDPLYHAAGHLAIETARALQEGDIVKIGELMNMNHGLLSAVGVSNLKLEELVFTARQAGAIGAKITGAGGGGSIVALAYREDSERIVSELEKIASRVFSLDIAEEGVKVHET